jgi:hypothetical protein
MPETFEMASAEVKGRWLRRFTAPFHAFGSTSCSSLSLMLLTSAVISAESSLETASASMMPAQLEVM